MIFSRNMLKRVGESRHPCQSPTVVGNQSPMLPLKKTAYAMSCRLVGSEMCIRDRVEAAVQSLKKGKSAGVDNIPAELVQAGGEDVITALTTICNKI